MPRRKRPKTHPAKSQQVKGPHPAASNNQSVPDLSSTKSAVTSDRSGTAVPKRKRKFSSSAEDRPPQSPTLWVSGDEVSPGTPESKKRRGEHHRATFSSSYTVGELLGTGGGGSVYAGTRKSDGEEVAIKYILKSKANQYIIMAGDGRRLPREVALMTIVSEPSACLNVVKLLDWFEDAFQYILVLERPSPCSDLFEFIEMFGGQLSEMQAKEIIRQVTEALIHCRNCGVFHRDLKSENILVNLNDWTVKLIDFGCGGLDNNDTYYRFAGTWDYCPPEYLSNGSYQAHPATTWSLGVLLFELVCGDRPFNDREDIVLNVPKISEDLSEECRELISWCLRTDPDERPALEDILAHGWLSG